MNNRPCVLSVSNNEIPLSVSLSDTGSFVGSFVRLNASWQVHYQLIIQNPRVINIPQKPYFLSLLRIGLWGHQALVSCQLLSRPYYASSSTSLAWLLIRCLCVSWTRMINRKGSVLHLETYVTTDLEEFDAMQKTERQSKACPTIDGTSSIATDFCIVSKPLKGRFYRFE